MFGKYLNMVFYLGDKMNNIEQDNINKMIELASKIKYKTKDDAIIVANPIEEFEVAGVKIPVSGNSAPKITGMFALSESIPDMICIGDKLLVSDFALKILNPYTILEEKLMLKEYGIKEIGLIFISDILGTRK